jgi:dihydroorotate dehydrogenase
VPDWSYGPIFRPLLFRLPPEAARDTALTAMGLLARLPAGTAVIDLLGRMRPPECVKRKALGLALPSPVGLGAGLDPHALALPALAKFGFGYLEIGPVTAEPVCSAEHIERLIDEQALLYPEAPVNDGVALLVRKLENRPPLNIPLGFRLAYRPGSSPSDAAVERCHLVDSLARYARFFVLETRDGVADQRWTPGEWANHLAVVAEAAEGLEHRPALLVCLPPDIDQQLATQILAPAVSFGIQGVVVAGGTPARGGRIVGKPTQATALHLVRALARRWGARLTIVGSGGILEPDDALRFFAAGATLVQVHSGVVYNGPGLAKRINEAVAYFQPDEPQPAPTRPAHRSPEDKPPRPWPAWVWSALFGAGFIALGVLAWYSAAVQVLLPSDEALVGISRRQIEELNPLLLAFMAHDRTSLAGPTIALGLLYLALAFYPIRHGAAWARDVVKISGTVVIALSLLQFSLGYFEPIHSLLLLLLLAFLVLTLVGSLPRPSYTFPNLRSDALWRSGLCGQLLFLGVGASLIGVGTTISIIGASSVFVPEDLAFMRTTASELRAAGPDFVALVAHDRAAFGCTLLANGIAVLLIALWGFRQGERWLWWALCGAWIVSTGSAFGTHVLVGYTDHVHLLPAAIGAVWYLIALVVSHPFLTARPPLRYPRQLSEPSEPSLSVSA